MAKKAPIVPTADNTEADLESVELSARSMRSKLKTPELTAAMAVAEYRAVVKKSVQNPFNEPSPFFFVTNFEFGAPDADEEEEKGSSKLEGKEFPLFFLGRPSTAWKQAIKQDYRKRKQFASGTCIFENGELILTIDAGKGKIPANKSLLNKKLFKKLGVQVVFADSVSNEGSASASSEDETELIARGQKLGELSANIDNQDESGVFRRIQLEVNAFKSAADTDERMQRVYMLKILVREWEDKYKGNKNERPQEADFIKKLKSDFLSKAEKQGDSMLAQRDLKDLATDYKDARATLTSLEKLEVQQLQANDEVYFLVESYLTLQQAVSDWVASYQKLGLKNLNKDIEGLKALIIKDKTALEALAKKCGQSLANIQPYRYTRTNNYDKKQLDALTAQTKLPESPAIDKGLKLLGSKTYKEIHTLYKNYNNIPAEDVEGRRLHLFKLENAIKAWRQLPKQDADEKAGVDVIAAGLFDKIKALGQFEQRNDNFLEIRDVYDEFIVFCSGIKEKEQPTPVQQDTLETAVLRFDTMVEKWRSIHLSMAEVEIEKKYKDLATFQRDVHARADAFKLSHENINKVLSKRKEYEASSDKMFPKIQKLINGKFESNKGFHTRDVQDLARMVEDWLFEASNFAPVSIKTNLDIVTEWKKKYVDSGQVFVDLKSQYEETSKQCTSLGKVIKEREASIFEMKEKLNRKEDPKLRAKLDQACDKLAELQASYVEANKTLKDIGEKFDKIDANLKAKFVSKQKAELGTARQNAISALATYSTTGNAKDQKTKSKFCTDLKEKFAKAKNDADNGGFMFDSKDNEATRAKKRANTVELLNLIKEWSRVVIQDYPEFADEQRTMATVQIAIQVELEKFAKPPVPKVDNLKNAVKQQYDALKAAKDADTRVRLGELFLTLVAQWKQANPNPQLLDVQDSYSEIFAWITDAEQLLNAPEVLLEKAKYEVELFMEGLRQQQEITQKSLEAQGVSQIPNEFANKQKEIIQTAENSLKLLAESGSGDVALFDAQAKRIIHEAKGKLNALESDLIKSQGKIARDQERDVLAPFQGYNVYTNFENVNLTDEQRKEYQAVVDKAQERTRRLNELGASFEECRRSIEHIPMSFWGDEFIEEFRMWKAADVQLQGKAVDTLTNADMVENANNALGDLWGIVSSPSAVSYDTNSNVSISKVFDLFKNETIESIAKYKDDPDALKDYLRNSNFNKDYDNNTLISEIGMGINILTGLIGTGFNTKKTIADVRELYNKDIPRIEKTAAIAKKLTNYIATEANKCVKHAIAGIETVNSLDFIEVPGVVNTRVILKSVSGLLTAAAAASSDDGFDAFSKNWKQNSEVLVDILLNAGMAAGDIASIFTPVGSVIASSFELAGDIKQLIKDGIALARKQQELKKDERLLKAAAKTGSDSLYAMRQETAAARKNRNSAIVNVVGTGVQVLGSSLKVAGASTTTASLAGGMSAPGAAVGIALTFSGQMVKAVGAFVKLGGKMHRFVSDERQKLEVEQLLKLARKGDMKAKRKVMEKSSNYAKMFLIMSATKKDSKGELNPDPIARQYLLQKGITESQLNDENLAKEVVLKYLQEATESSGSEIPILTKRFKDYHQEFVKGDLRLDKNKLQLAYSSNIGKVTSLQQIVQREITHFNELESCTLINRLVVSGWSFVELKKWQTENITLLKNFVPESIGWNEGKREEKQKQLIDNTQLIGKQPDKKFTMELIAKNKQLTRDLAMCDADLQVLQELQAHLSTC